MNAPILAHRHLTPRPFFARHADIDFTIDLCAAPEKVVALLPRFFSPLLLPLGLLWPYWMRLRQHTAALNNHYHVRDDPTFHEGVCPSSQQPGTPRSPDWPLVAVQHSGCGGQTSVFSAANSAAGSYWP